MNNTADHSEIMLKLDLLEKENYVLKQQVKNLKNDANLYQQIFDHMSSGVTVLTIKNDGQDFIVKRINCAAEKILQKNQTEVVGKRLFELYPMIDSFGLTGILRQVWLTGQPEIYPICLYEHSRLSKCLRNYVCKLQSGEIINMCDDLTQEKQFEEDMRINKERLESALQASGAGICECNLNTNEIYLSPQALRIFGLDESYSTINFNLFQTLILPDFRSDLQKHLEKIKNSQIEKFSFQYQIQTADGQKKWIEDHVKVESRDQQGNPLRLVGTMIDVTPQKSLEKLMYINQFAINHASDAITLLNHEAKFIYVNQAACESLEYSRDQLLNMSIFDIDPIVTREYWKEHWLKLTERKSLSIETLHRTQSGKIFPVEISCNYFKINNQEFDFTFVKDITERKQAEYKINKAYQELEAAFEELTSTEETLRVQNIELLEQKNVLQQKEILLRSVLDVSPDLIIRFDSGGCYLNIWSPDASLLYLPAEQMLGRCFMDILPPESSHNFCHHFQKALTSGNLQIYEYPLKVQQGESWFEARILPNENDDIIVFIRDISEKKRHEIDLEYLTYHDTLTKLYNRNYWEKIYEEMNSAEQLPLSFIMCDVNGLKLINDVFGHRQGDILLIKAAQALQKCSRRQDKIYRWGGDEFIIQLPNTAEAKAWEICNQIKNYCSACIIENISLSISLGAATRNSLTENLSDIIAASENTMYHSKLLEKNSLHNSFLVTLKRTLYEKTHETEAHASRLQNLSLNFGKIINLPQQHLDQLQLLAALHDIGKIGVKDSILNKPARLTIQEFEHIKMHPEIGYRIANATSEIVHIAELILSHHERWDGTGYPRGLKAEEIPYGARIISIIDAFDVMIEGRPYQKAKTISETLEELQGCAGTQFDPYLVEQFIKMIKENRYSLD